MFCWIWHLFHRVKWKYLYFMSGEIKAIFNKKHLNFVFHIQQFQQRDTFHFSSYLYFLALSLDNEHESMLKGKQIKCSEFSSISNVIKSFNVISQATS